MSPSVEEIRKAAEARIRELEPVIREIAQLQKILRVTAEGEAGEVDGLDVELPDGKAGNGSSNGRVARGSNRTVIMEIARDHPGITAPEVAAMKGIKRQVVSATMYRLKKQGNLEDYGKGVRVATAPRRQRKFILELAESRPGLSCTEIADAAGLDPVVAEVTVAAMQKDGELAPADGGLVPVAA